jgi:hypothetical protein
MATAQPQRARTLRRQAAACRTGYARTLTTPPPTFYRSGAYTCPSSLSLSLSRTHTHRHTALWLRWVGGRAHTQDGPELAQWFGTRRYVLLRPLEARVLTVVGPDLARTLLGALRVVAGSAGWYHPCFVQVDAPARRHYRGCFAADGVEAHLATTAVATPPRTCTTLGGLASLLGTQAAVAASSTTCIRLTPAATPVVSKLPGASTRSLTALDWRCAVQFQYQLAGLAVDWRSGSAMAEARRAAQAPGHPALLTLMAPPHTACGRLPRVGPAHGPSAGAARGADVAGVPHRPHRRRGGLCRRTPPTAVAHEQASVTVCTCTYAWIVCVLLRICMCACA